MCAGMRMRMDTGVGMGMCRWVFDEMRALTAVAFRFRDVVEPSNCVMALASAARHFPPEHAMSAPYLFEEWAPQQILDLLAVLTPHRMCITHVSQCHTAVATMREPWYGTAFTVAPIDEAELQAWASVAPVPELRWPEPNPFIPTDFALACDAAVPAGPRGDAALKVVPKLLRDDSLAAVWHKTDATFRRPKLNVYMEVVAPCAYASPDAACLTRLLFRLITDELTEFAYPAGAPARPPSCDRRARRPTPPSGAPRAEACSGASADVPSPPLPVPPTAAQSAPASTTTRSTRRRGSG